MEIHLITYVTYALTQIRLCALDVPREKMLNYLQFAIFASDQGQAHSLKKSLTTYQGWVIIKF